MCLFAKAFAYYYSHVPIR